MKQRLGGSVVEAHYELERTRVQQVLPKHTETVSESLETKKLSSAMRVPWLHDGMETLIPARALAAESSKHLPSTAHETESHKQWWIYFTLSQMMERKMYQLCCKC